MTRRDYICIARALSQTAERFETVDDKRRVVLLAARAIANECQLDNPRFNANHFLAVVRGEKNLHSRPARNGEGSAK